MKSKTAVRVVCIVLAAIRISIVAILAGVLTALR